MYSFDSIASAIETLDPGENNRALLLGAGFTQSLPGGERITLSTNTIRDTVINNLRNSGRSELADRVEGNRSLSPEYIVRELNLGEEEAHLIHSLITEAVVGLHPVGTYPTAHQATQCSNSLLCHFRSVYTTNYDLVLYRTLMRADLGGRFPDGFQNFPEHGLLAFEHADQQVFYLHGGIHLWLYGNGCVQKLRHQEGNNLIDQATQELTAGGRSTLVMAGDADSKARAIRQVDYLSRCLDSLIGFQGSIWSIGFGFNDNDRHIAAAISANRPRVVCIGIHDPNPCPEISRIRRLFGEMGGQINLQFFSTQNLNFWGNGVR